MDCSEVRKRVSLQQRQEEESEILGQETDSLEEVYRHTIRRPLKSGNSVTREKWDKKRLLSLFFCIKIICHSREKVKTLNEKSQLMIIEDAKTTDWEEVIISREHRASQITLHSEGSGTRLFGWLFFCFCRSWSGDDNKNFDSLQLPHVLSFSMYVSLIFRGLDLLKG